MHLHQTPTANERSCACGALISDDEPGDFCVKCRARARWQRRSNGRHRHSRRDSTTHNERRAK
jgi:hypothetical protein